MNALDIVTEVLTLLEDRGCKMDDAMQILDISRSTLVLTDQIKRLNPETTCADVVQSMKRITK